MRSVEIQSIRDLVGLMLAADGPRVIPARINWPLHKALHDLHEAAGRRNVRSLRALLTFRPSADVSLQAQGADGAMFDLVQRGVLRSEGSGRAANLHVDPDALIGLRRDLMRLDPQAARLVQWAGARWAALVATSAKNRSRAERSFGSTVASSTPKRLHELPGRDSTATSRRREPRKTRLVIR
jgi:hypothetical protein